jgi:proton glutamate symport protein
VADRRDDVQVHEHSYALCVNSVGAAMASAVGHCGLRVPVNHHRAGLYVALTVLILGVFLPVALIFKVAIRNSYARCVALRSSPSRPRRASPLSRERWRCRRGLVVPRRIVSFILPLGYKFNLDGTTLYLSLDWCVRAAGRPRGSDR